MDGKQIWAKNIGVPETSYGYSSSLLIYKNILIVQFDSNSKYHFTDLISEPVTRNGKHPGRDVQYGHPLYWRILMEKLR